jgi:DNA repair photolyase
MFPTAHDITPYNVDAYIRVAKLILEKGNRLLIVSKPNRACMQHVMTELKRWKTQILLRYTIGTTDDNVSRLWEPGAPLPMERLDALGDAEKQGYARSVSIEPMLGGVEETLEVIQAIENWNPETIWIGKMNKIRLRVSDTTPEVREAVNLIEWQQRDSEILRLVAELDMITTIRWKDSIKEVIAKNAKEPV